MACLGFYPLVFLCGVTLLVVVIVGIRCFPCEWMTSYGTGILGSANDGCPTAVTVERTQSGKHRQVGIFTQLNASQASSDIDGHVYADSAGSYLRYCQHEQEWHTVTNDTLYILHAGDEQASCPPLGSHWSQAYPLYEHVGMLANASIRCFQPSHREWKAGKGITLALEEEGPQQDSVKNYQLLALACLAAQTFKWIMTVGGKVHTTSLKMGDHVDRALLNLHWIQGHFLTKILHNGFYAAYICGLFITNKCVKADSTSKCGSQVKTLWLLTVPLKICITVVPVLWLLFWFRVKSCGCQLFDPQGPDCEQPSESGLLTEGLLSDSIERDERSDSLIDIQARKADLEAKLREVNNMKMINERLQFLYTFGMSLCRACLFMNLLAGCSVLFAFKQVTAIKDAYSAYCSPISPLVLAEMLLSMVWLVIPLLADLIGVCFPAIYAVFMRMYWAAECIWNSICVPLGGLMVKLGRLIFQCCHGLVMWLLGLVRWACGTACVCLKRCLEMCKAFIVGLADGKVHCPKCGDGPACPPIPKCGGGGCDQVVKQFSQKLKTCCSLLCGCLLSVGSAIPIILVALIWAVISFPSLWLDYEYFLCLTVFWAAYTFFSELWDCLWQLAAGIFDAVRVLVGSICSARHREELVTCIKATPAKALSMVDSISQKVKGRISFLGPSAGEFFTMIEKCIHTGMSRCGSMCSRCGKWCQLWSHRQCDRLHAAYSQLKPRFWIEVEPVSKTYGCGLYHTKEAMLEALTKGSIGLEELDQLDTGEKATLLKELEELNTLVDSRAKGEQTKSEASGAQAPSDVGFSTLVAAVSNTSSSVSSASATAVSRIHPTVTGFVSRATALLDQGRSQGFLQAFCACNRRSGGKKNKSTKVPSSMEQGSSPLLTDSCSSASPNKS